MRVAPYDSTATERVSTEALIQRFSSEKPDFLVIDPMASGAVNAADKFSIPYMYMHTSGLPMVLVRDRNLSLSLSQTMD